jgi:hypothetical protein
MLQCSTVNREHPIWASKRGQGHGLLASSHSQDRCANMACIDIYCALDVIPYHVHHLYCAGSLVYLHMHFSFILWKICLLSASLLFWILMLLTLEYKFEKKTELLSSGFWDLISTCTSYLLFWTRQCWADCLFFATKEELYYMIAEYINTLQALWITK